MCVRYSYDYEGVDSAIGDQVMAGLETFAADQSLVGKEFTEGNKTFTVAKNDNFEYVDPIDGSVSKKQVLAGVLFI